MARVLKADARSAPDPYGDAYDDMLRRWLAPSGDDPAASGLESFKAFEPGFGPPDSSASSPDGGAPALPPAPPTRSRQIGGLLTVQPPPKASLLTVATPTGQAKPGRGRHTPIGHPGVADALIATIAPPWPLEREVINDIQESPPVGRPGKAESFIPIWGSGREAVADLQDDDYLGAAFNGGLAMSDVGLVGAIGKGVAKGAVKVGGPYVWRTTLPEVREGILGARQWMGAKGIVGKGVQAHHGVIPNNGWGKAIPDWIKNQPWNITSIPSAEVHGRIHHSYRGLPRFNLAQRYYYGTPPWAKAATTSAAGHGLLAAQRSNENNP